MKKLLQGATPWNRLHLQATSLVEKVFVKAGASDGRLREARVTHLFVHLKDKRLAMTNLGFQCRVDSNNLFVVHKFCAQRQHHRMEAC